MTQSPMQSELPVFAGWSHLIDDIPSEGLSAERTATASQLEAVAKSLGLDRCENLTVHYTLAPQTSNRVVLKGRLSAEITQPCIISLDPVCSHIDEDMDVEFLIDLSPDEVFDGENDQEILKGRLTEAVENGELDVGRLCFEVLSAAIEPFPRKPGAKFQELPDTRAGDEKSELAGPFAVLGRLKGGQDS